MFYRRLLKFDNSRNHRKSAVLQVCRGVVCFIVKAAGIVPK